MNVYAVPFANPDTVQLNGPVDHEHCCPPGLAVTVYPVTAAPPESEGATHDTTACPFPGTADTDVGAPGTVRGVTADDAALATLVPSAFDAVTVNVYAVPFDNPVTVHPSAPVVHEQVRDPGFDVTE